MRIHSFGGNNCFINILKLVLCILLLRRTISMSCMTGMTFFRTWVDSSSTPTRTLFGCGPNGARVKPCISGTTALNFVTDCINSGGHSQKFVSHNLAPLNATSYRATVGLCDVANLQGTHGGRVRITIRTVDGVIRSDEKEVTSTAQCDLEEQIVSVSVPNTTTIEQLTIEMIPIDNVDISGLTLFEPKLCTDKSKLYYNELIELTGIRFCPRRNSPAKRMVCYSRGINECTLTNTMKATPLVKVPSFLHPTDFFGGNNFSLKVNGTDNYLLYGTGCKRLDLRLIAQRNRVDEGTGKSLNFENRSTNVFRPLTIASPVSVTLDDFPEKSEIVITDRQVLGADYKFTTSFNQSLEARALQYEACRACPHTVIFGRDTFDDGTDCQFRFNRFKEKVLDHF